MPQSKAWYEQPAPRFVAHRSAEEHAAVAAALEVLPADHPARTAFAQGVGTIELTHLVTGYLAAIDALRAAYIEASGRLLQSGATFRPFPARTRSEEPS